METPSFASRLEEAASKSAFLLHVAGSLLNHLDEEAPDYFVTVGFQLLMDQTRDELTALSDEAGSAPGGTALNDLGKERGSRSASASVTTPG